MRRGWCGAVALFVILAMAACASRSEGGNAPGTSGRPTAGAQAVPLIEHVAPEPDSTGKAPTRFEWTSAANANAYTIAVWSEVGMLIWRVDHVRTTWVTPPADPVLAPGTYVWSVTAWRADRVLTESGRAAFVVRQ